MSAAGDGSSVSIDTAFTDYAISLIDGSVIYARPTLQVYVPTVNLTAHTITMTAPEEAFPQEPEDDVFGVMIYSHSAFYSSGTAVAWDYTSWDGTGYAFTIGTTLYIFSGLFCKDYMFSCAGFGRYLLNTTMQTITYPAVAWTWNNLYTLNASVSLDDITNKAGGLAQRDISSGADPETVENIANKSVKCGWYASTESSASLISARFQSEGGSLSQIDSITPSATLLSVNISTIGKALLIGYTSYLETAALTVGTTEDTLSITMDADIPKTCQVFTFGDYAPDENGSISLIQANIVENADGNGTWNRIFPCARIYDRGPNSFGYFTVLTDSMADSFAAVTLAQDTTLGLSHWRNSVTGFNISTDSGTGYYEFVPASTADSSVDALGNALTPTATLRRDICAVIVEALENAGVY